MGDSYPPSAIGSLTHGGAIIKWVTIRRLIRLKAQIPLWVGVGKNNFLCQRLRLPIALVFIFATLRDKIKDTSCITIG